MILNIKYLRFKSVFIFFEAIQAVCAKLEFFVKFRKFKKKNLEKNLYRKKI